MKKVSKKQSILNRAVAKIKASKADRCMICGRPYTDAAHLLPRSLYPEYYTEEWNIVPLCREHHTRYDNNRAFRRTCTELYEIVKAHDELAANRYFDI
jgi:5-methylcytosine-specific restriction endonuclease McrA